MVFSSERLVSTPEQGGCRGGPHAEPESLFQDAPSDRIAEQLLAVERMLWLAEVDHLDPETRLRRGHALTLLHAYAQSGRFPRNSDFLEPRPHLLDDAGWPCAVAHLAMETGSADTIERLAQQQNNAWIYEIDDAELAE